MMLTIIGAFLGAFIGGAISYFISRHFYRKTVKEEKLAGKIEGDMLNRVQPYMIDTTAAQQTRVKDIVHESAGKVAQAVSSVFHISDDGGVDFGVDIDPSKPTGPGDEKSL
jgi:hypothetical protein